MAEVKKSVWINRPIDEVFTFVADQSKLPLWQSGISDSGPASEGPMGVGTKFGYTLDMFGRRYETSGVITEYEPNQRYGFKSTSGSFAVTGGFTFKPARGGTRVTFAGDVRLSGLSRVAGPLVGPYMEGKLGEDFERLKEVLESEAGATA